MKRKGNGYPVLLGSTKKSWGWSVEGKLNHSKKLVPYSPIWEEGFLSCFLFLNFLVFVLKLWGVICVDIFFEVSNEKNFFIVQMEYSANERFGI